MMRILSDFNDDWLFEGRDRIRLPHNAVELPFSYFDERVYQKPFTYSKAFQADPAWEGREVSLRFDGAMANTVVRLNGEVVATHADGYTPFVARLTGRILPGTNHLSVTVDGTENPAIPPFGNVIDYLTYAGIYREVWLQVTTPSHITNVKIETPDIHRPRAEIRAFVAAPQGRLTAVIRDASGAEVVRAEAAAQAETALTLEAPGAALWSPEAPNLYTLELTLTTPEGTDSLQTRFGFRKVVFSPEGFFLNGTRIKLRGLNRHQSFPHVGYGLGRAAQIRDAEIIKRELRCNIVRSSHYPASKHFLDACDELGLMVFEEIPGWQHIGDKAWQKASVENVRAMITRDWNHPSIVIWGVRINESQDNHDFYKETNAVARSLDRTRPTGGVRYITDSEFLEDVYTMNDFILGNEELGGNRPRTPLRPQAEVTGLDRVVPYMITEYGGHMYPTKSTDQEQRQAEHVLRHLEVLNAMYGDPQIAGAIGWCAFDYNTHKDFGSGDRICHHGVMDMFREPKFAAFAYASQSEPEEGVILKPVTFWARGERNIGGILPLMILTNCDEVELRYGNHPPKRVSPDRARFPHLPHPPVIVDNRVFSKDELGLWGMKWEAGTVTGFIGGRQVAKVQFAADPVATRLEVAPDATKIGPHDAVRVMIRALDQVGNKLPFFPEPVSITVTGPARRVGPGFVPLRAGATGVWLQALAPGEITLTVSNDRLGTVVTQIISE